MNLAFYTASSGLSAYQQEMNVLANNMANVNTNGFKPSRISFGDLLYTKMKINKAEPELSGHGVKAVSNDLLFGQGVLNATGYPLDFAISGNGFFATQDAQGNISYTRNGAFDISMSGKSGYLVTSDGKFVLDASGKKIKLATKDNSTQFDLSGIAEKIGVYTFSNPYGLQPSAGSSFLATETSGTAVAANKGNTNKNDLPYTLYTGVLEFSGVDLAQSMADVMVTQKAYQFSAKMVQTADEIEEIVNNLR